MHYFGVPKLRKWFRNEINHSTPIRSQIMFESVSDDFANLQHVKRGKTCVSGINALFRCAEVAKMVSLRNQPFYPTRPQMIFVCVSKNFANIQHVKRRKTCVLGINALFRCAEVEKMVSQRNQPFYPTRSQMIFECFEAFPKPSACQMRQNFCLGPACTFFGYRSCKNSFATKSTIPPH